MLIDRLVTYTSNLMYFVASFMFYYADLKLDSIQNTFTPTGRFQRPKASSGEPVRYEIPQKTCDKSVVHLFRNERYIRGRNLAFLPLDGGSYVEATLLAFSGGPITRPTASPGRR